MLCVTYLEQRRPIDLWEACDETCWWDKYWTSQSMVLKRTLMDMKHMVIEAQIKGHIYK